MGKEYKTLLTENINGVEIIKLNAPPLNLFGKKLRVEIVDAIEAARNDDNIKGVVLTSSTTFFSGGADITEFDSGDLDPSLPFIIDNIAAFPKPFIVAVNGPAFGGGCEISLGSHRRLMTPNATFSLPEVKLGILPGAGGTQRMPRLINPALALDLIIKGGIINAKDSVESGLASAVYAPEEIIAKAVEMALDLADKGQEAWQKPTFADPSTRADFDAACVGYRKKLKPLATTELIIEAIATCYDTEIEAGLKLEGELFLKLLKGAQSKALRYVFFSERETTHNLPGITQETPAKEIKKAAVIGGGTMGGGIAMCFANAGIEVKIIETSDEALNNGIGRIKSNYDISVKRGSLKQEKLEKAMSLITGSTNLEDCKDADIVIEAIFEDMNIKKELFQKLDKICKPDAILASNTSFLNIEEMAAQTSRPENVIGLHFFSPANVMRLLEIVNCDKTSAVTLNSAVKLAKTLKKLPVVSGVCFGFIGNRMLMARIDAANEALLQGALPHEIDEVITEFGFAMGHFAMSDLAGLDIGMRITEAFNLDPGIAGSLAKMGRLGQKNGKGFYKYSEGSRIPERDEFVENFIAEQSKALKIERKTFNKEELIEILFYPMINEGAKILEEKIALKASDIDMVWINGFGWPAYKGGPMYWAGQIGLDKIVHSLEKQHEQTGNENLKPCELLQKLGASKSKF